MASCLPDKKPTFVASLPFLASQDAHFNPPIPDLKLEDVTYLEELTSQLLSETLEAGDNAPLTLEPGTNPTANILPDEPDDQWLANVLLNGTGINSNTKPPAKRSKIASASTEAKKPCGPSTPTTIVNRVTPDKAPGDKKDYLVVTLSNGLRAVLVKRPIIGQSSPADEFVESVEDAKKCRPHKYIIPPNFPNGLPLANPAMAKILHNLRTTRQGGKSCKAVRRGNMEATLAVVVNVGCTDDPDNCIGLAHFTEHMVHLGSEKYPDENAYWNFEFSCSSNSNAYTENNTTTYYSTVSLNCISQNMDMVGSMLSKPLFRPGMTLRELQAVDSEFHLKKHYDVLRRWFLFQHAIGSHPLGKMGFGNEETLLSSTDIHKAIRSFHSQYYVASAMTLAFESTLPFEAQEELVLKNFSGLLQGTRGILRETPLTAQEKRLDGKGYNLDYVVQGLSSYSSLWLLWTIPGDLLTKQGNKSLLLLTKALRDDRPGGLIHYLIQQQYIWLLLANSPLDSDLVDIKYVTCLHLEFFLTPEGESHVAEIVQATYVFLHELISLPDSKFLRDFQELQLDAERSYTYLGSVSTNLSPTTLAASLQQAEEKDVLKTLCCSWSWKDAVYTPGQVQYILQQMVQPSKMMVIQTLPSTRKLRDYAAIGGNQVCIAPFTNAEYVVMPITKRFGELNQECCKECAGHYRFKMMKDSGSLASLKIMPISYGRIAAQEIELETWKMGKVQEAVHLGNELDNYFLFCNVRYVNPEVKTNSRQFALSLLWVVAAWLSNSYSQRTESYAFVDDYGINLVLSDSKEDWLSKLEAFNELFFNTPVSETKFKAAQAALLILYDMWLASDGDYVSQELMHFMACIHSKDALADALTHIGQVTAAELNLFATSFKWGSIAGMVFGGNISLQRAQQAVELINRQCAAYNTCANCNPRQDSEWMQLCLQTYKHFPVGERWLRLKHDRNYGFTNTVSNFYCVGSYDPAKYLLWLHSLLLFPMRAYQYLRTIKQLGYSVRVYYPAIDKPMIIGVSVTATAAKFTPCELNAHLDAFMIDYGQFLNTLSEPVFEALKKQRGLADQPQPISLHDAQTWYHKRFGDNFANSQDPSRFHKLFMGKISVQVLSHSPSSKACSCAKCKHSTSWNRCTLWKSFEFAQGSGPFQEYFIDDPLKIRNGT